MSRTQRFRINGMTCQHCVQAVAQGLRALPGVESAEVSIAPAQALVTGDVHARDILRVVADAGYLAVADEPGVRVV